ncbi:MAG: hypothetical protein Q7U16_10075 [Agitococcus sp.]|nr:hypothetical protein [Agitococcus sp.]
MPTIAQAIAAEMIKKGRTSVWFGHFDIWHAGYLSSTGKSIHPKDAWQSVRTALANSKEFEQKGYIRGSTWSGREILHPRYFLLKTAPLLMQK